MFGFLKDGTVRMIGRRRFMLGLGAVSCCGPSALVACAGETPKAVTTQRKIVIRYGFSVTNVSEQVIDRAVVSVCAPANMSGTQRCERLPAPADARIVADRIGNQTACFTVERLAPRAVALLKLQAELLMGRVAEPSPNGLEVFKAADRWVQSDHPDIIRAARKLQAGDTVATARGICHWVAEHVKDTGYVRSSQGAVCALQTGKGDCTESAVLFSALCRAAGIPARVCGGFLTTGSAVLGPANHHNWAEFHDGRSWSLADPNKSRFCEKEDQYVAVQVWSDSLERTGLVKTDCDVFEVRMLG